MLVALVLTLAVVPLRAAEDKAAAPAKDAAPVIAPIEPLRYPMPEALSAAGRLRLQAERAVMAVELGNRADVDEATLKRVVAEMQDGAKDTVEDNLQRFAKALAAVLPKFKEGYDLYQAGKWTEAIEAFKPLMHERPGLKQRRKHNTMPPYAYQTTKFLHAECCGRVGDAVEMVIAYQIVFEKLPDNLTFSAAARWRAAQLYENTGRIHWALPIYKGLALHFADMLTDLENLRLAGHVADLLDRDPYRRATRVSGEVTHRLQRRETGERVLGRQEQLIEMLTEMLAMAEEEDRPWLEHSETISSGGEKSSLKEGGIPERLGDNEDFSFTGSDDWGKLRPRELKQLMDAFNETYPQRYREMLEDYFKGISDAESAAAQGTR